RSCFCLSRRHLARISIRDMFALSSMNSGASAMRLIARAIACQSRSSMGPSRMRFIGTCASAESRRIVISVLSISSEKITEVWPLWIEAERSTSMPRVVLPIAGRPAKMIICPPCRPCVRSSSSAKPVGTPVTCPPRVWVASIVLRVSSVTSPSGMKAARGDGVLLGLGLVDRPLGLAAVGGVPQLDDAGAGLDQAAQGGPLDDDLGVVAGVRRRGDHVDEVGEVGATAHPGQLAALGELVGDGDEVRRLAPAVQVD